MTAGWQKIFHDNPKIWFLAQADRFNAAIQRNEILAPIKQSLECKPLLCPIKLTPCYVFLYDCGICDVVRCY